MTSIDVTLVDDVLDNLDTFNDRCVRTYSGRGMYGTACFGVTFRTVSDFAGFMVRLAADEPALADGLADRVQQDSLGLDTIYYFPGFVLDGDSSYAEDAR